MEVYTAESENSKARFYHSDRCFWRCKKCGNIGGKLGFTMQSTAKRFAFCPYCDEGTQQESVEE